MNQIVLLISVLMFLGGVIINLIIEIFYPTSFNIFYSIAFWFCVSTLFYIKNRGEE